MMKNKVYIYESPDKGKTIFRREFGVYGNRERKVVIYTDPMYTHLHLARREAVWISEF